MRSAGGPLQPRLRSRATSAAGVRQARSERSLRGPCHRFRRGQRSSAATEEATSIEHSCIWSEMIMMPEVGGTEAPRRANHRVCRSYSLPSSLWHVPNPVAPNVLRFITNSHRRPLPSGARSNALPLELPELVVVIATGTAPTNPVVSLDDRPERLVQDPV
jgi:hypothetical protein